MYIVILCPTEYPRYNDKNTGFGFRRLTIEKPILCYLREVGISLRLRFLIHIMGKSSDLSPLYPKQRDGHDRNRAHEWGEGNH